MNITVHIGAPKTGSTALQQFLAANAGKLAQYGCRYPDVNLRGFGHHDLAFLLHGQYPEWATPQPRTLDALAEDMRRAVATKPREIVLSSEDFYIFPAPSRLREFLAATGATGGVRVVVYLRRQDEAHISWYNQIVKAQGYCGSMEDAVRDYRDLWDYHARLSVWADVFGRETLAVRVLDRTDIRKDFLELLDLDMADFRFAAASPNARINRDLLEYQRQINREPLSPQKKRRFHKALIALTAATAETKEFDDTPLLDPAARAALLQDYAESNRAVARTFFDRNELFTTPLPRPDCDTAWPGLSPAKAARIADWIENWNGSEN